MLPQGFKRLSVDAVQDIALAALTYVAGDEDRLMRFLDLTGLDPDRLRAMVGQPSFSIAMLDYIMSDEPLLLAFAAEAGLKPELIARAHFSLQEPPSEDF
jgi:Protein of unknown function (DUF3572)